MDFSFAFKSKGAENIDSVIQEFSSLAVRMSILAEAQGILMQPLSAKGLKKFATLSPTMQREIVKGVNSYLDLCRNALSNSVSLRGKNHSLSWWTLAQLKLRPPSDMYGYLEDDHLVEIYNSENIQIYRSFDLFQYLSYSLSEIFAFNWHELYQRDEKVFSQMAEVTGRILSGEIKETVFTSFPDHYVEEIFSPSRNCAKMRHSFFSPLYAQDGSIGGFFSAFKIVDFKQGM